MTISNLQLKNKQVGRVEEGSTTSTLKVTLNESETIKENSRVTLTYEFPDGSREVGLGRVLAFETVWLETNIDYKNSVQLLHSEGYDSGNETNKTVTTALIEMQVVYKIDKDNTKYPPEGTAFSNVPKPNTEVELFDGIDSHILDNAPYISVPFGYDYSDGTINMNHVSGTDIRGEGRNKIIIGQQGCGKTELIKNLFVQHNPYNISIMVLDIKGDFSSSITGDLRFQNMIEESGRQYKEISCFDIIEDPTLPNIKNSFENAGLYKSGSIIVIGNGDNEKYRPFVDYIVEELFERNVFESLDFDIEKNLKEVLQELTADESTFLETKLSLQVAKEKKKVLKRFLKDDLQFAKLVRKITNIRFNFIKTENKFTCEELVAEFLNTERAVYVINNKNNINNFYVEQIRIRATASKILNQYYLQVDSAKKMRNHGFLFDEAQTIFARNNSESIIGELNKECTDALASILSKHRSFGAFVWLGIPNQKLVHNTILDLANSHERYIGAGLSEYDFDKFISGISPNVLKQYQNMPLPRKTRINGKRVLKNFHFLLAGEQSPYELGNNGHIVKFEPAKFGS